MLARLARLPVRASTVPRALSSTASATWIDWEGPKRASRGERRWTGRLARLFTDPPPTLRKIPRAHATPRSDTHPRMNARAASDLVEREFRDATESESIVSSDRGSPRMPCGVDVERPAKAAEPRRM